MKSASSPAAISCPNCGAGLNVLGGGRVVSQICGYCSSELDAVAGYRVLSKFAEMPRPETPLKIGDSGKVLGVDHQIIGILGWREEADGKSWDWTDHLIYSPTHGYSWLTLEARRLFLTRRWRQGTQPGWVSEIAVETSTSRPQVRLAGQSYAYYETSKARITFAEGEFTWRPHIGDRATTITLLGSDAMLSFTETGAEREVERTVLPPQTALWQSFGFAAAPVRALGRHPLETIGEPPNERFLIAAAAAFAGLGLLLSAVFASMSGHQILPPTRLSAAQLPVELPLEVDQAGRLTVVNFRGDLNDNTWAWLEVTVSDPDDQPMFQIGRELGRFSGHDSDGSWTESYEGSQLRFRPEEPGRYMMEIDLPERGIGETTATMPPPPLTVSARAGAATAFPTLGLATLFALIGGGLFLRRSLREKERWSGSDWEDEDTDAGGDDD
ncbi:DUF4178 domain-containing protein [Fuscibacter oryzae]|uniref:DUF4178 domain-containing protein n=1 Tax=Fuscibacter oryzae TaxID=2803939 RepID=A0A8J7MQF3_9RHOB|nr:DUF4178 domain-containing protein [Fuscibacter oryzae]MBL4928188.1 DUF4178 domain-containing protein [Fuscibacter oryzae]